MRELVSSFLRHGFSRREFLNRLAALGSTASAAAAFAERFEAIEIEDFERRWRFRTKPSRARAGSCSSPKRVPQALSICPRIEVPGKSDSSTRCGRPEIQLLEALHEGVVVSMANGYHKVSGRPALVNVHTIAGTRKRRAGSPTRRATARQSWSPSQDRQRGGATRRPWRRAQISTRKKSIANSRRSPGKRASPQVFP